jgi:hypothetical protein
MEIDANFKNALLGTIEQLVENEVDTPVVFKWSFSEYPEWQIALGFRLTPKVIEEAIN